MTPGKWHHFGTGFAAAEACYGDYCWGYGECREYSYDPQPKTSSTRTCGSFKGGAFYTYQAKEVCARQK
jgi:hypothetical protein